MVSWIKQGSMSVPEYEELFLSHPIMKKKGEQYLIKIAIDGLKKEIRDGFESTEFPTLRSLFQEAADVEDILEKEKKKRRLNSPRRRTKKRRLNRFFDPEMSGSSTTPPEYVTAKMATTKIVTTKTATRKRVTPTGHILERRLLIRAMTGRAPSLITVPLALVRSLNQPPPYLAPSMNPRLGSC
ncbi:hypothetical protein Bca52824_033212 [Brassica carinata]|uniref:Retrotransposon gag domain-containing protein n=1 Tax=Brassica carinata TaxID=52824 RepID=A0A8X7V8A3_BRACI|nr:hypothetical protein Bca52824_033212 [Brassica carinata]